MGGGKFTDANLRDSDSRLAELQPSSSPTPPPPLSTPAPPLSTLSPPPCDAQDEKRDRAGEAEADGGAPFRYPVAVVVTVPAEADDSYGDAVKCAQMLAAAIVARSRLRLDALDLVPLESLLFRRLVGVGGQELEHTRVAEHRGRTTYPLIGVSLATLRHRLLELVPHESARDEWQRRVDQVLLELSHVAPADYRVAGFLWWCALAVVAIALVVIAATTWRHGGATNSADAADTVALYAGMNMRWHDWFGAGGPLDAYFNSAPSPPMPAKSAAPTPQTLSVLVFLVLPLILGTSRSVFDAALAAAMYVAALYGLRLVWFVVIFMMLRFTVSEWFGKWCADNSSVPGHLLQSRQQIAALLARHVAQLQSAPACWVAPADSDAVRHGVGCGQVIVVREGAVLEALKRSYADPSHPRYGGDAGVLYVRLVAPVVANADKGDGDNESGGGGADDDDDHHHHSDDERDEDEEKSEAEPDETPLPSPPSSTFAFDTVDIPYADDAAKFCVDAAETLRKRLCLRPASP